MADPVLGTIRDTQQLKDVRSDVDPAFRFFNETLKVKEHSTRVLTRSVSGNTLIWGNTQKSWGSPYLWGSSIYTSFILSNPGAGVLGSSQLGSSLSTFAVIGVINPNGIWYEALRTDTFKDSTNTTATWDTTNFRWTFAGSDQIQTSVISWNENITITTATLYIESDQITNGSNLTYYLSADDGSNWEEVNLSVQHTFTNTGKKLKLKITASGSAQIDVDDSDENSYPLEVRVNQ